MEGKDGLDGTEKESIVKDPKFKTFEEKKKKKKPPQNVLPTTLGCSSISIVHKTD